MLRIILAVLLCLISLLGFFRAPTHFFWLLAIVVTEYFYFFALASIIVFVSSFWARQYKAVSLFLSVLAVVLFCIPVYRTYQRSLRIEEEMNKVFSPTERPARPPFQFNKIFTGIHLPEITPQTMAYKNGLSLDFYSAGNGLHPCVVVVFGGAWMSGDSKQLPELNKYLTAKGYHVAAINYRLAPQYQCPAQIDDVADALTYLKAQSPKLGIDTNKFVLLGRSAGGQIALLSAYKFHDPDIRGVIDFYAPADMVWGATAPSNKWVLNTDKVLSDYIGGSYKNIPEKYVASSPCEFVDNQSPPTLMIHGKIDAMVSFVHTDKLSAKLEKHQVKYYLLDLPSATHGFDFNFSGPDAQLSTYAIEYFLNAVTAK